MAREVRHPYFPLARQKVHVAYERRQWQLVLFDDRHEVARKRIRVADRTAGLRKSAPGGVDRDRSQIIAAAVWKLIHTKPYLLRPLLESGGSRTQTVCLTLLLMKHPVNIDGGSQKRGQNGSELAPSLNRLASGAFPSSQQKLFGTARSRQGRALIGRGDAVPLTARTVPRQSKGGKGGGEQMIKGGAAILAHRSLPPTSLLGNVMSSAELEKIHERVHCRQREYDESEYVPK
jgi:hypothetical protein